VVESEIVIQLQAWPTDRQVGRNVNQSHAAKQEVVRRKHARVTRGVMVVLRRYLDASGSGGNGSTAVEEQILGDD
jgi:hypothetical protein